MSALIYRGFDIKPNDTGDFDVMQYGIWYARGETVDAAQDEVDRIKKLVASGKELKPGM